MISASIRRLRFARRLGISPDELGRLIANGVLDPDRMRLNREHVDRAGFRVRLFRYGRPSEWRSLVSSLKWDAFFVRTILHRLDAGETKESDPRRLMQAADRIRSNLVLAEVAPQPRDPELADAVRAAVEKAEAALMASSGETPSTAARAA